MSMPSSPRSARVLQLLLSGMRCCSAFLSWPEQTSVSGFFLFREVDLCCVLVSFDAGLLWRGHPEVQASDNPKRPVTQQMSAASEQLLLLVSVPSQYQILFSNDQLH